LLRLFDSAVPEVVDEIAFQPRRSLGQRALADVIPFRREDQVAIRRGAMQLAAGRLPAELPPRFLVSASAIALASGAPATELSNRVVTHLSNLAAAERNQSRTWLAAVA
jgi:predicted transcriptional regulator